MTDERCPVCDSRTEPIVMAPGDTRYICSNEHDRYEWKAAARRWQERCKRAEAKLADGDLPGHDHDPCCAREALSILRGEA